MYCSHVLLYLLNIIIIIINQLIDKYVFIWFVTFFFSISCSLSILSILPLIRPVNYRARGGIEIFIEFDLEILFFLYFVSFLTCSLCSYNRQIVYNRRLTPPVFSWPNSLLVLSCCHCPSPIATLFNLISNWFFFLSLENQISLRNGIFPHSNRSKWSNWFIELI